MFLMVRISFGLFAAAMLIATIGDGFASLVGIKYGKHIFPKGGHKTVEGYIAGFFGSFGIASVALFAFDFKLPFVKILLIALGGAGLFLVIDLLNLRVDDNILNPIFCGYFMVLLNFIL